MREYALGYAFKQRPAKLCRIVGAAGFGMPILADHQPKALRARIFFSSDLKLIVKPRCVEINGEDIVDEQPAAYLAETKRTERPATPSVKVVPFRGRRGAEVGTGRG
jgi:hypothetical protein